MEHIENPFFTVAGAVAIGFMFFAVMSMIIGSELLVSKTKPNKKMLSIFLSVLLGFAVAIGFAGFQDNQHYQAQKASVEEHYNIEFTDREFLTLEYPKHTPTESFELFGTLTLSAPTAQGKELAQEKLTLAWYQGEMILYVGESQENFVELSEAERGDALAAITSTED